MLYVSRHGELGAQRVAPLSFTSDDAAIEFMRNLHPAPGCTYTMMLPDGLDCRGFTNWKSIIKRGADAEVCN